MPRSLKIVLSPFGSEGDVNPLVWAAKALMAGGHSPHLLLPPKYAARAGDIPWTPVGREGDFESMVRDPRFWHPVTGPAHVADVMVKSFPEFLDAFRHCGFEPDLVITSSFGLAAAFAAEAAGIPRLTIHMQPAVLLTLRDCPVFAHGLEWLPAVPDFIKRLAFAGVRTVLNLHIAKGLNSLRRTMGLPPVRDIYRDVMLSGDATALLFPLWFASPQPEWPANTRQFGFPIDSQSLALPAQVSAFLEKNPNPLLWTHGSANHDTEKFHRCAIRTSENLGQAYIIVGPEAPEEPISERGLALRHLRFEDIFPHCRAIIHHGGIGTTAKAIAAGRPQLVIPRAHDQPDNAARVERLGLGLRLPFGSCAPRKVSDALTRLLSSQEIQTRCLEFAPLVLKGSEPKGFVDFAESLKKHDLSMSST